MLKWIILILSLLISELNYSQVIHLNDVFSSRENFINTNAKYIIYTTDNKIKEIDFSQTEKLQIPFNCKSIDLVFTLTGTANDSLYIYTKQKIPKLYLYKIINGKAIKLGSTGFATKILENSVKNENNCILFPKDISGTYIAKITREKYKIGIPNLYLGANFVEDKKSKKVSNVSLMVAGFQFCIFLSIIVYLLLNKRNKTPKILIFFLLINITDAIYFLAKYTIIILEIKNIDFTNSQVWNIIGDLNIILYYIFFISFFNIPKKSIVYYIASAGSFFWLIQIFIELSNFQQALWTHFAIFYLDNASVVDMIVTLSILFFVLRYRMNDIYYRIGSLGLFCITISTVDIASPHIIGNFEWQGLSEYSYNLLQICVLINMMCFVSAILYKSIMSEKEKNQYKTKILLNEIEKQKSLQTERNRISGDMHDELGAGISAIKLQSEILRQQIDKNKINYNDIDEIIRISDEMKISMREMLWSLNSKNDFLDKFAVYCTTYLENYFSKTNIKTDCITNICDNEIQIPSDKRRAILLVIKEACHNIIKHSHASQVKFEFYSLEKKIQIQISDNGIGFNAREQSEGYGLSTMQARISSISGKILFQSSSTGTYISIII